MTRFGDPRNPLDAHGNERVRCEECGMHYHRLDVHLGSKHKMTVTQYQERYPGSPVISEHAKRTAAAEGVADEAAPSTMPKPADDGTKPAATKPAAEQPKPPAKPKGELKFGIARVYMRDDVGAEDQWRIPANNPFYLLGAKEKQHLQDFALGVQHDENVMLVGPTGCGKTTMVKQFCCAANWPLMRFNFNGQTMVKHLLGTKTLTVDEASGQSITLWEDGPLPYAMRNGLMFLADEVDTCTPEVLMVLQAVLEPERTLLLSDNGNEIVPVHPFFRFVAACNTLGRGDETGLYTGTNVLNEATLDRFGTVLNTGYPSPATEQKIVVAYSGIEDHLAEGMVAVANKIREAKEREEVFCEFSTRRLIAWGKKTAQYDGNIRQAAKLTITNKLSPDDAKVVDEVIRAKFGKAA